MVDTLIHIAGGFLLPNDDQNEPPWEVEWKVDNIEALTYFIILVRHPTSTITILCLDHLRQLTIELLSDIFRQWRRPPAPAWQGACDILLGRRQSCIRILKFSI